MSMRLRALGGTGLELSALGFGGTAIGGMYRPTGRADAIDALDAAWRLGIRHFDTAPLYGLGASERLLGDYLRGKPRGEYTLSTKVGRLLTPGGGEAADIYHSGFPFGVKYDYSYDGAMRSLEDSLQRLGLAAVDMALIHDIGADAHGPEAQPAVFKAAMAGAYRALDELRRQKVIKAVGLGVNEWQVCMDAMQAGAFDCFLLAGRYTLLERTAAAGFLSACAERGVAVIAGGVFNSGVLAAPREEGLTYNYGPAPEAVLRQARVIADVCDRHGVPVQAAALQFPARHPAVACVLCGARSRAEIEQDCAWFSAPIPDALWDELSALADS